MLLASASARSVAGRVAHSRINEAGSYLQPMIKYGSNGVYVVGKCQTEKVAVSSALVSARPAAGWVACSRHAAGSMKRHHTCNLRSNTVLTVYMLLSNVKQRRWQHHWRQRWQDQLQDGWCAAGLIKQHHIHNLQ